MIIADTHVHIYPRYDLELFFRSALNNLRALGSGNYLLCLTERSDCHFFADHLSGEAKYGMFRIAPADSGVLSVTSAGEGTLLILPGRQVATAERIEVIGLGIDEAPPDGSPARHCIEFYNERGAVTVLPWSAGKWSGERGKFVHGLIREKNLEFLLGDPAHRPRFFPVHSLFTYARGLGRKVLCGTDPLPLPGEEARVGQYATALRGEGELRSALKDPQGALGDRLLPWESGLKIAAMITSKSRASTAGAAQ